MSIIASLNQTTMTVETLFDVQELIEKELIENKWDLWITGIEFWSWSYWKWKEFVFATISVDEYFWLYHASELYEIISKISDREDVLKIIEEVSEENGYNYLIQGAFIWNKIKIFIWE